MLRPWIRLLKRWRDAPAVNGLLTWTVKNSVWRCGLRLPVIPKHLPRIGRISCRLPNGAVLRLASKGDDWIPNQVYWRGWDGYERETARLFFAFARDAETTIDVGAHVGYYSILAALANPNGAVIALEPLERTRNRLAENLALSGVANVEVLAVAAHDQAGESRIHVPRGSAIPCSAGLSGEFYRPWANAFVDVPVATETIDRLWRARGCPRVSLIKIDTEGTEPAVLRGAIEVLRRDRPWIICEVLEAANTAVALERLLGSVGYRFGPLSGGGVPRPASAITGDERYPNYLFWPSEREP